VAGTAVGGVRELDVDRLLTMKRILLRSLCCLAVSFVGRAGSVHGQEFQRDSLVAEAARLRHEVLMNDLEGGVESLVRSSVGPFDVLTLESRRERTVELVEERWSQIAHAMEGLELGRTALVVTLGRDPIARGAARVTEEYDHTYRAHQTGRSRASGQLDGSVGKIFRDMMREAVADGPLRSFAFFESSDRSATRDFFRVPLEAVTRCQDGEADQCWRALGLVEAEPAWHGWTTEEERRAAVEALDPNDMEDKQRAQRMRCVRDHADGICDIIIADRSGRIVPSVRGTVRDHFLWRVLEESEPGGFTRLVEARSDDVRAAITAAGQRPANELILEWVQSLGADPAIRAAAAKKDRWAAVFWILLLAIPAMRSRRWHLR